MATNNRDFFQLLAENCIIGLAVTDNNGSLFYSNKLFNPMLDFLKLHNKNLVDFIHKDKITFKKRGQNTIKVNKKTYEISFYYTQSNDSPIIIWSLTDITSLSKKDETLFCLLTILDYINEGIIVTDPDGIITIYNKQVANFEGLSQNQVLGKSMMDVYDVTTETSCHMSVFRTGEPALEINRSNIQRTGKEIQVVASTYPIKKEDKVLSVFSVATNVTKIRELFSRTLELQSQLLSGDKNNRPTNGTKFTFSDMVGESPIYFEAIKSAKRAANSPSPVFVFGETGTGKELFAQSMHNAGPYRDQPFIGVNCAAIPESLLESLLFGTTKGAYTGAVDSEGLFAQAKKGTLFLDEINSMSMNLQAKLLRVLQEKTVRRIGANFESPVTCRIISSTNINPSECVTKGTLRQDLFYRLNVITITVPPLRERIGDIEILAGFFLQKNARLYGKLNLRMSSDFLNILIRHSWPGNVRELEHVIESCVAMLENEEELLVHHLPPYLTKKSWKVRYAHPTLGKYSSNLSSILLDLEKQVILDALESHNWNLTQAGKSIGIGRQNMQYRMNKLGISKPT